MKPIFIRYVSLSEALIAIAPKVRQFEMSVKQPHLAQWGRIYWWHLPPLAPRAFNLAASHDVFEPSDFHLWHRGEEEVCVIVEGRCEDL
jgi:hypothetical protein